MRLLPFARRLSPVQGNVSVKPAMYIVLPAAMLLLPLRWVLAWIVAVAVHEFGHYLALKLCRVPVYAIEIAPTGVKMVTGELRGREALLCALAGPIFGLSLTLFAKFIPCTAFCAFLQGMFNLLPIYPLDGGRALRAVLQKICRNPGRVETGVAVIFAIGLVILGLYVKIGIIPLIIFLFIFLQKFLAKDAESRYNR